MLLKNNNPEELDEWLSRLLFSRIRDLGIFSESGIWEDSATLRKKAGVLDKYVRWWEECCLGILETSGYLHREGRQVQVSEEIKLEKAEESWEAWQSRKASYLKDPETQSSVSLVDDCLSKLPEILTGTVLATDIVFPRSSMGKVENIYKNNALSDYFNTLVAEVVITYVKRQIEANPEAKIRIIEIGAGTGGTTSMVLPRLSPFQDYIQEYCYTDISKAFLLHAEEHYGTDYPFLACKLWNIEEPLAAQGIAIGAYDIVIATTVLSCQSPRHPLTPRAR